MSMFPKTLTFRVVWRGDAGDAGEGQLNRTVEIVTRVCVLNVCVTARVAKSHGAANRRSAQQKTSGMLEWLSMKKMKSDLLFAMVLIPRKIMADQVSQQYPNIVQTLCHDDNVLENWTARVNNLEQLPLPLMSARAAATSAHVLGMTAQ